MPKTTRFFLFNTTPNGNYQVLKNGSPLASVIASPHGVLTLTDIVDVGDILAFSLDGVQTQPPAPPGNVIAIESGPGCVTVSWLAGGEPDLAGYTLYYGGQSVSGGQASAYDDSVAVGLVTARETCGLPAGTYYFALKARNAVGQYSAYSSEVVVSTTPIDVEAPTVSITDPIENALLVGTIIVDVSANDNVGVAGVRLLVDGLDVGVEDTQAPFQLSLSSPTVADGPHALTAIARDAAGNTATSTPIAVFVDNDADPNHPAVLLGPRIADMRARACYDADGNPLPACTPGTEWTAFNSFVASYVSAGTYAGMRGWHFALIYRVTKDPAYAARAIAIIESEIANGFNDERSNDYEDAHEYLRDAAMVYDWTHVMLDGLQLAGFTDYMNQLVHEIWDAAGNPYNVWSGADVDNPGSYRYYRFLLGTLLVAVATDGENPAVPQLSWRGTTYSDLISFANARIDQEAMREWLTTYGQGGGWHEGDYYGLLAKLAIVELFSVMKEDGQPDYLASTTFAAEAQRYHFYSTQPGSQVKYGGGDLPTDPTNAVGDLDRRLMLLYVAGYGAQNEGQYAQHWLDSSASMQSAESQGWEFILARPNQPSLDYQQLPPDYVAGGLGWVHSRSAWQDDAVALTFATGEHEQARQHFDQNAFVVYRDGWLAADAGSYSGTGTSGTTDAHNTLIVDGFGQRGDPGTGGLIKHEFVDGRAYAVGDASEAYSDGNGEPLLQSFNREIVYVKPDHIIVFDRVTPTDSNSTVTYLLHTRNQPAVNGDEVQAVNGGGKLFHRTVLPAGPSITATAEQGGPDGLDSWRVEIEAGQASATTNFLNVIYPTASTTNAMPAVTAVHATSGNMVGVQIDNGAEDIVVMFSTDPLGAPPSGSIIYDVGITGGPAGHTLTGLRANADYRIDVLPAPTTRTIVVTRGRGLCSSAAGVLHFYIGDESVAISSLDTPIPGGAPGRR